MRNNERGNLDAFDHVRYCKCLAGAGDAEQGLVPGPAAQAVNELTDRLRLVAGGLEIGNEMEIHMGERYMKWERMMLRCRKQLGNEVPERAVPGFHDIHAGRKPRQNCGKGRVFRNTENKDEAAVRMIKLSSAR